MKVILAFALKMWSKMLFVRSHGVLLLIIVPRRVIIFLSDWIFLTLMNSVKCGAVTGKLSTLVAGPGPSGGRDGCTITSCRPHLSLLFCPLGFDFTFNLCSLPPPHIFYNLGSLLKSFLGGNKVEIEVRKNWVKQSTIQFSIAQEWIIWSWSFLFVYLYISIQLSDLTSPNPFQLIVITTGSTDGGNGN